MTKGGSADLKSKLYQAVGILIEVSTPINNRLRRVTTAINPFVESDFPEEYQVVYRRFDALRETLKVQYGLPDHPILIPLDDTEKS